MCVCASPHKQKAPHDVNSMYDYCNRWHQVQWSLHTGSEFARQAICLILRPMKVNGTVHTGSKHLRCEKAADILQCCIEVSKQDGANPKPHTNQNDV